MPGKTNKNMPEGIAEGSGYGEDRAVSDRSEWRSKEENLKQLNQQKRVNRMRKHNVRMLLLSVIILIALCACLLARIYSLNETVDSLKFQMTRLNLLVAEQQEQLGQLQDELKEASKKAAAAGNNGAQPVEKGDKADTEEKEEEDIPKEPEAAHKVYLTFDDGPSIYTQDILDILEEYDVKATFFVVGKESKSAQESMKKIVEAGHTLAMHSYSHKYSELYASVDNFAEDFTKLQEYIYDVTGVKSQVYRFPGGSSNTVSDLDMELFGEYLHEQGVVFFDWNISSGDGGSAVLPVETLLENCTSTVGRYSTSVILMHDSAGKKTTVEALPEIIETILAMDDTVILPITQATKPVQHRHWDFDAEEEETEE